jgi:hypothetical protein
MDAPRIPFTDDIGALRTALTAALAIAEDEEMKVRDS